MNIFQVVVIQNSINNYGNLCTSKSKNKTIEMVKIQEPRILWTILNRTS